MAKSEEQPPKKRKDIPRRPDGTAMPGYTPGRPFGPDNPPPKSPGRPKKDAWVRALEEELENDPELPKKLARRIRDIALLDDGKAALAALKEIQDRVGGPVVREQIQEIAIVPHSITRKDVRRDVELLVTDDDDDETDADERDS